MASEQPQGPESVYKCGNVRDVDDNMRATGCLTNRELKAAAQYQGVEISVTKMHLARMEQHRWELAHELYEPVNSGTVGPDDSSELESRAGTPATVRDKREELGAPGTVGDEETETGGEATGSRRGNREATGNRRDDSRSPT